MAGTSNITGLESITFTDNMSFDGTERGGAMDTDGQLWIGSTASRHVKKGMLVCNDGTVTIGYDSPDITLSATGGGGGGGTNSGFIQQVRTSTTTAASTTKVLSDTGTTPTTANCDLLISLTITPTSTSNYLIFDFTTPYGCSTDGVLTFCIFEGNTFKTAFPVWQNGGSLNREGTVNFRYFMLASAAASTTYHIYWATNAGTARTLQNGLAGTALYGGAGNTATQFIITEVTQSGTGGASSGIIWSDTSGSVTATAGHGYFVTATCTSTLPASPVDGDTVEYILDTTDVLTITASGTDTIRLGSSVSAGGGTAVSTAHGDSIILIYRATNGSWLANDAVGTWVIT